MITSKNKKSTKSTEKYESQYMLLSQLERRKWHVNVAYVFQARHNIYIYLIKNVWFFFLDLGLVTFNLNNYPIEYFILWKILRELYTSSIVFFFFHISFSHFFFYTSQSSSHRLDCLLGVHFVYSIDLWIAFKREKEKKNNQKCWRDENQLCLISLDDSYTCTVHIFKSYI